MNTIGLENQPVHFYLKARRNSPIWGTAQDMLDWLSDNWEKGCPVKKFKEADVVELPVVGLDVGKGDDVTAVAVVEDGEVKEVQKFEPVNAIRFKGIVYVMEDGKLKKKKEKA